MSESPTPDVPKPRPVPDLGFFAGPPTRAGSGFGGASAAPSVVAQAGTAPAPARFGEAAPTGYLPVDVAAPPSVVPQGVAAYPYQLAPPPRSGLPGWAIALIAVAAGLLIVMVLAAVAIPTFLNQRSKANAAATTVTLPETLDGLERVRDPEVDAVIQRQLETAPRTPLRDTQGAAYSDGEGHIVVVTVSRFPRVANSRDVDHAIAGYQDAATTDLPPGVTVASGFQERPAGRLGGRISCVTVEGNMTGQLCAAVESSTLLFVVDMGPSGSIDPDLPRRVREAVVHRTAQR